MSAKMGWHQHNLLHQMWPNDCCLCKNELKINLLKTEIKSMQNFIFLSVEEVQEIIGIIKEGWPEFGEYDDDEKWNNGGRMINYLEKRLEDFSKGKSQ